MAKMERRDFLKNAVKDMATGVLKAFEGTWVPRYPRPPGAATEMIFLATCTRCGKCIEACTSGCIIYSKDASQGIALGTPYMDYTLKGCNLCLKCIEVCTSGALSENLMGHYQMGTAEISCKTCIAWNGAICMNCIVVCKQKAIVFDRGRYPKVQQDLCIGCGVCSTNCLVNPRAITVKPA